MISDKNFKLLIWMILCPPTSMSERIFPFPTFTRSTQIHQQATTTSTEIPWQSQTHLTKKDWDNLRRYQRSPPSQFAPGGRLHSVEKVMEALSSEDDPTSNLVLALQCKDGIVVVSHAVNPPNAALFLPKPSNATKNSTEKLWTTELESILVPLSQRDTIFCITAGNAVHSQVLKHRIRNMAESMAIANDDGLFHANNSKEYKNGVSASILARRLADHLQKPTQSLGGKVGRILVCSALIVEVEEGIWQVDPTGQFWQCRVAVVGRGALKARTWLLHKIAMKIDSSEEEEEPKDANDAQVHDFLNNLSMEEAMQLARECIQATLNPGGHPKANNTQPSKLLLAFSIGEQGVRQYIAEEVQV